MMSALEKPRWSVASETGVLIDVLMARPEHFRWFPINEVARRAIAEGKPFDRARALAEFDEVVAMLGEAGITVHLAETGPEFPLQVFTRDSSQVTPWGPVLLQPFRAERRGEIAPLAEFYGSAKIARVGPIEGGDIHIVRPGLIVVGVGERTSVAAAKSFAAPFAEAGWEVRLVPFPEVFLHLDCLFCMAADGLAVLCEDVLDDTFLDFLKGRQIRWIPATYKEVMRLGANVLSLGRDRVVSVKANRRINDALKAQGLAVYEPDLDILLGQGGAIHCMTMPLERED